MPVDLTNLSDHAPMERLCHADMRAFETLYDRYSALVYSIALRALSQPSSADDVVQEVFLRLWERGRQFDSGRGSFVAWLVGVARNCAIDERRRLNRRMRAECPVLAEQDDLVADTTAPDPSVLGLIWEERVAVQEALRTLPVEQRFVLELAYFQGLTQQEIANSLGHPLGTVKTRIRLGMQKVRCALEASSETRSLW